MMNDFKFSVLMSVYGKDNPAWFRQAVQSVLNQSVAPAEVVLAADGPLTEELEAVITEFKDNLKVVRLEKNMGLGAALNAGLKECSYPLVARMDSDDISLPDRFEKQIKAFVADKNLAVLGGAIREIDSETKEEVSRRILPSTEKELKRYLKTRSPFNHVSVMFKKEQVLTCGGYLPLYFAEDYYLWIRMAAQGRRFSNLQDILVNVRIDPNMFARRGGWKYFKSNKAIADKMLSLGLISFPTYIFNLAVRFCVQVLMPNSVRSLFYKKVLR
ncbi:MAG: glycosyltransferase [Elusimicrobia bacterium]|nr:glycosyltransferase [Elusimicrobiota bacterium]